MGLEDCGGKILMRGTTGFSSHAAAAFALTVGALLIGAGPAYAGETQVSFTLEPGPLHLGADGQVRDRRGTTGGWTSWTYFQDDVRTTSVL